MNMRTYNQIVGKTYTIQIGTSPTDIHSEMDVKSLDYAIGVMYAIKLNPVDEDTYAQVFVPGSGYITSNSLPCEEWGEMPLQFRPGYFEERMRQSRRRVELPNDEDVDATPIQEGPPYGGW